MKEGLGQECYAAYTYKPRQFKCMELNQQKHWDSPGVHNAKAKDVRGRFYLATVAILFLTTQCYYFQHCCYTPPTHIQILMCAQSIGVVHSSAIAYVLLDYLYKFSNFATSHFELAGTNGMQTNLAWPRPLLPNLSFPTTLPIWTEGISQLGIHPKGYFKTEIPLLCPIPVWPNFPVGSPRQSRMSMQPLFTVLDVLHHQHVNTSNAAKRYKQN